MAILSRVYCPRGCHSFFHRGILILLLAFLETHTISKTTDEIARVRNAAVDGLHEVYSAADGKKNSPNLTENSLPLTGVDDSYFTYGSVDIGKLLDEEKLDEENNGKKAEDILVLDVTDGGSGASNWLNEESEEIFKESVDEKEDFDIKVPNEEGSPPVRYKVDLYGNISTTGYYFMYLFVGTPPQRQTVIIDSGSALLSFTCSGCTQCGEHISQKFEIDSSATANWTSCSHPNCRECENDRCKFHLKYVEGSQLSGQYFSDFLSLGNSLSHTPKFKYDFIGCHSIETNLFANQLVSGIAGLGLTLPGQETVIDRLLRTAPLKDKYLSICLSSNGGQLSVGAYDEALHKPNKSIVWEDMLDLRSLALHVNSVSVGDTVVADDDNGYTALVDTGTTFSYFPQDIYDKLLGEITKHRSAGGTECSCMTVCWEASSLAELAKDLPTIRITLSAGKVVEWEPESYLTIPVDGCVELGIASDQKSEILLGMSFMKQHQLILDKIKRRVGIVSAACPVAELETERFEIETNDAATSWWDFEALLPKDDKEDYTWISSSNLHYPMHLVYWTVGAVAFGMLLAFGLTAVFKFNKKQHSEYIALQEAPAILWAAGANIKSSELLDFEANSESSDMYPCP